MKIQTIIGVLVVLCFAGIASAQNPMTPVFPGGVATDTILGVACNGAVGTLSSGIDNATLSIPVTNGAPFCYRE